MHTELFSLAVFAGALSCQFERGLAFTNAEPLSRASLTRAMSTISGTYKVNLRFCTTGPRRERVSCRSLSVCPAVCCSVCPAVAYKSRQCRDHPNITRHKSIPSGIPTTCFWGESKLSSFVGYLFHDFTCLSLPFVIL